MGGFGSGERLWKKRTTESCPAIDTADLRRWGWLGADGGWTGRLTWGRGIDGELTHTVGYELHVGGAGAALRLRYESAREPGEAIVYRVALEATPCRYGGRRWWFRCPLSRDGVPCRRRVRKVYLCGRYFGCRHCHDLTYRSRQRSDARVYALARRGLDALRPAGRQSVCELGVMMKALTLLRKRFDRPLRLH